MLDTLTFKEAITEFLEDKTKDNNCKDNVLATFYNERAYTKLDDISVEDHELRISQLCDYIDFLPGIHTGDLSDEERKNIFYNTFLKKWNLAFRNSNSVKNSSIPDIEVWMIQHKKSQDKERKKRNTKIIITKTRTNMPIRRITEAPTEFERSTEATSGRCANSIRTA